MRYWLMKTEPDDFSIDDLAKRGREPWSGVRNYQARNYMRDEMQPGDGVLVYHSSCPVPGVYGTGTVASTPYPDPSQFDRRSKYHDPESRPEEPRWQLVDVAYGTTFAEPVTLEMLKVDAKLEGLVALRRGNRLSITPVERAHYARIVALGGAGSKRAKPATPAKPVKSARPATSGKPTRRAATTRASSGTATRPRTTVTKR